MVGIHLFVVDSRVGAVVTLWAPVSIMKTRIPTLRSFCTNHISLVMFVISIRYPPVSTSLHIRLVSHCEHSQLVYHPDIHPRWVFIHGVIF